MANNDKFDVKGRPLDENCLHCLLFQFISKFLDEHPEYCKRRVIADIGQVGGEFIGSAVIHAADKGNRIMRRQLVDMMANAADSSAVDLVEEMQKQMRSSSLQ